MDDDLLGQRILDWDLLDDILSGEDVGRSDVEVAVALLRLAHDELEAFGTGGDHRTSEPDMRRILQTCRLLLDKVGVGLDLPFSDFRTFKSHWLANGAYGSWQARRNILNDLFDPAHVELVRREDNEIVSTLTRSCQHSRGLSRAIRVQAGPGSMMRSTSYAATSRRLVARRTTAMWGMTASL